MHRAIRVAIALGLVGCSSTATNGAPDRGTVIIEGVHCYFLPQVHFARGSARVLHESIDTVASFATAMNDDRANFVFVEIAGFASTDEPDADSLSMRRASAVRDAIIALGVEPGRLRARGYGAHCPQSDKADETEKDRRIELEVLRTRNGDTGVELGCEAAARAGLAPEPLP